MALPTLAQRLVEAELAYHNLQVGGGVQRVQDATGESVTYTTANVSRLRAYIADLKAQIAGEVGGPGGCVTPVFAIR
jgi:hypothetical protein